MFYHSIAGVHKHAYSTVCKEKKKKNKTQRFFAFLYKEDKKISITRRPAKKGHYNTP